MNNSKHEGNDLMKGVFNTEDDVKPTISKEIVGEKIDFSNEDTCLKLLFCFDNEEEEKDLADKEIDEILFDDFKSRLEEEEFELDEEEIDFEFNDDSMDFPDITLEQAVTDFVNGIGDAFNYIYSHYKPILGRWGRRYNNDELGYELLDVVLLNAVKTFNSEAGTKFNTYFWTCAQNYVNCNRIKNNAQKRAHNKDMTSLQQKCMYKGDQSEVELETMIEDDSQSETTHDSELRLSIMAMSDCLKENEIRILLSLLDSFTLQEIGDDLGITAAAVCMALKRIAKKKNAAKKLKEILTQR